MVGAEFVLNLLKGQLRLCSRDFNRQAGSELKLLRICSFAGKVEWVALEFAALFESHIRS